MSCRNANDQWFEIPPDRIQLVRVVPVERAPGVVSAEFQILPELHHDEEQTTAGDGAPAPETADDEGDRSEGDHLP